MTPSQKAKQILGEFYSELVDVPQSKRCSIICIDQIIDSLDKNRGYTQCLIDIDYWKAVKVELDIL